MNRVTAIISALVICIIVCLSWAVNHYRDNAITYKAQRDKNARELKLANAAITDMQMRQRDVAALGAKYTKELADAKAENDALRDDVAAGRRRLHIKAVCQSVREATTASRDKNARELKLANAAITDMQMRQRDVAALDAKYTKELADAKAENDVLRDDVAAGRRRLHIKAVCQSVREATTASVARQINPYIKVDIPETTRGALYSFVYNVGAGNFRTSTLLRKINQGDIKGACDQLRRWTYAGGKQWKGLMTRREIEREICLWGQQ